MFPSLLALLGLRHDDRCVLRLLGPLFVVAAGSAVIVAAFSKALFLHENPLENLPWMYLGASLFTVCASLIYVMAMERLTIVQRFNALLTLAVVSFVAMRLAYPYDPQLMSFVLLIWCSGIAHLILVQTWNLASGLLPSRQSKRLLPVCAALATLGAATGGALTQGALHAGLPAYELIWIAVGLLLYVVFNVKRAIQALAEQLSLTLGRDLVVQRRSLVSVARLPGLTEAAKGFSSLRRSPVLARLTATVFLLQIASVLVDYQFSAELKINYDQERIAGFLGTYYCLTNLVAFFIALMVSSRVVRRFGIGWAIASSAVVMALGCLAYFVAGLSGLFSTFFIIVVLSSLERITTFALTRNAMQMLIAPIDVRDGERAKTLIDGVVQRLATIVASGALLLMALAADQLHWLSPMAFFLSALVAVIASRIGRHYCNALFDALRAGRLDTGADPQVRAWVAQTVHREVNRRLARREDVQVLPALDVARELQLPPNVEFLIPLLAHRSDLVVARALEVMSVHGHRVDAAHLLPVLQRRDGSPAMLREALRMLRNVPGDELDETLEQAIVQLKEHQDPGVSTLARMSSSALVDQRLDNLTDDPVLRMLHDCNFSEQLKGVELVGQIGLPKYIPSLVALLGHAQLAGPVMSALHRFGSAAVEPIRQGLAHEEVGLAVKVRALRALERVGNGPALHVLMALAEREQRDVRDRTILSIWRMGRDGTSPVPPSLWVNKMLVAEYERLRCLLDIALCMYPGNVRRRYFANELYTLTIQTETQVFRLLGLGHPRAALYRAHLNYRAKERRTRSNAIELLDQHIVESALRPAIGLLERSIESRSSSVDQDQDDVSRVSRLSGLASPWLARVWEWTMQTDNQSEAAQSWPTKTMLEPMDTVFLLKGVALFQGLTGEELLPVVEISHTVTFDEGEIVFEQGHPGQHVYVVLSGAVEVLHDGERIATMHEKQCFGEMALLDQGQRSASIRCLSDVELLSIAHDDFHDLIDIYPALAKGVIRVLTGRLRESTQTLHGGATLDG